MSDLVLTGQRFSNGVLIDTANVVLSPAFGSGTTTYTADVANDVERVSLSGTYHARATLVIKLDGTEDDDGTVDLAVGANVITAEVTAEDGNTVETYTVTVTRAAAVSNDATLSALAVTYGSGNTPATLRPGFAAATESYRAAVVHSAAQVTVTPTPTTVGATIEYLDGSNADLADADAGTTGHQVTLAVGETTFKVKVTDGTATETYTVVMERDSTADWGWTPTRDINNILKAAGSTQFWGIYGNATTLWVAVDEAVNSKLYAYTLPDGARHMSSDIDLHSDNTDFRGIWSDGTTMWVVDQPDRKLYAYALSGGTRDTDAEFDLHSDNANPEGIWSDQTTMWVADSSDNKIYAYALSGGARQDGTGGTTDREFALDTDNANSGGIWSNGTTLWVADLSDSKIYAYTLADGARDTASDFSKSSAQVTIWGISQRGPTMWVMDPYPFGQVKAYSYNVPAQSANALPVFPGSDTGERSVAENAGAGTNVGDPVTATDVDAGNTLTYSLEGTDSGSFTIVPASGQIQTKAGVTYDHEAKSSYSVTVKVNDGTANVTKAVTISVTDVAEPPGAPAAPIVSAKSGTDDSLGVNWSAPANTGPDIDDYNVRYRIGTTGSFTSHSFSGTGTSTTIAGLTASTSYQVQVQAHNDEGDSPWSASGTASTNAPGNAAPTFPATETGARSVAENTASGQNVGSPVAATDTDAGDTLAYSLEGTDGGSFTIVSTSGQIQTSAALDYEAKTSYSVTVRVNDGTVDATKAVTISVTDVDEPPDQPAAPTVAAKAGTTDSLDVSWSAPANTGRPAIDDYNVQYRIGTTGPFTSHSFSGTGTSTTIAGLTADTSYQVQVQAHNDEGDSPRSASGTGSTNAPGNAVPVFPSGTITRSVAENTASGQNVGSPVAATDTDNGDTLTYSLDGADGGSFGIVSTSGQIQTSAALNYEAKSSYSVTVKVNDGTVNATKAVTISVTDVDEPPDQPAAPTVSAKSGTDDSLDVRWTAPANTGPPITDYDVRYRVGTTGPFTSHSFSGTGTSTTIGGLTADTEYEVQVRASNVEDTSPWSASGTASTNAATSTVSSDATLSGLSLRGVSLSRPFASGTTTYTANVGNSVSSTTVTATTSHASATAVISPADADANANGHQVNLGVGDTRITVEVTAEDDNATETYTVTVNRAAQQQTAGPTLVSNTGQATARSFPLSDSGISKLAQRFTTGSNEGGYRLTSIGVEFGNVPAASSEVVVTIRHPEGQYFYPADTVFATLTNPATFTANAVNTFTAPPNTVLAASTTYYVHVELAASATSDVSIGGTQSTDEDPDAAEGWSIPNVGHRYGASQSAWSVHQRNVYQITVAGSAAGGVPNIVIAASKRLYDRRGGPDDGGYRERDLIIALYNLESDATWSGDNYSGDFSTLDYVHRTDILDSSGTTSLADLERRNECEGPALFERNHIQMSVDRQIRKVNENPETRGGGIIDTGDCVNAFKVTVTVWEGAAYDSQGREAAPYVQLTCQFDGLDSTHDDFRALPWGGEHKGPGWYYHEYVLCTDADGDLVPDSTPTIPPLNWEPPE